MTSTRPCWSWPAGAVEGDTIVLHGDLRQRIEPLLTARGVRKITLG